MTAPKQELFCKQCCREEFHKPVTLPILVTGMLVLISGGLLIFLWPKKCICCGTARYMPKSKMDEWFGK